ncbi:MAG: aminoacyl-tRNA hydrolase [SAR202 cluster bacterium]|nr:aminoacyl-tRNA hydrolase [SAR202 cluster bacterium]
MKFVVGLGNPGPEYAESRHNIGFMCVDSLAKKWGVKLGERRKLVVLEKTAFEGTDVVLAKPRTFMNASGEAVAYLLSRFGGTASDLIIVYDEMDLPLGTIRIRGKGSSAGQKGIGNIIATLGNEAFPRLRVGIGRAAEGIGGRDYVLSSFEKEERVAVKEVVERAGEAIECLLREGLERAMNKFN